MRLLGVLGVIFVFFAKTSVAGVLDSLDKHGAGKASSNRSTNDVEHDEEDTLASLVVPLQTVRAAEHGVSEGVEHLGEHDFEQMPFDEEGVPVEVAVSLCLEQLLRFRLVGAPFKQVVFRVKDHHHQVHAQEEAVSQKEGGGVEILLGAFDIRVSHVKND